MSYDMKVQGTSISRLPTSLGAFSGSRNCEWYDVGCHAQNTADDIADAVDSATGGAWSKTREAREGAAEAITSTVSNIGKSVTGAVQSTTSAVKSFVPPAPTEAEKREFFQNPVIYVVNKVTAPAAGWFVELMQRLVQRTGRRSINRKLTSGETININLVPKASDNLIQTSLKLVAWLSCCTFAFNEEIARKIFGFPVGKKGFFGSYDLEVPGIAISSLPSGPSGAAFRFGESDFWTDGIGPTGVEETAGAALGGLSVEGFIIGISQTIITGLFNLLAAQASGKNEVTPAQVGDAALASQINAALATLPDSDFEAGGGSQARSPMTSDFLPLAVGGAVGVSLLLLLLYKTKKK